MTRIKFKAGFIGRQLSRLKTGQSYYTIIMTTINAISLVSMAFEIDFIWLLLFFPGVIFATYLLGLFMDKRNIVSDDSVKANDMTNRFLNIADIKYQEFQLVQFSALLDALQSIQENKKVDKEKLLEYYSHYLDKWKPKSWRNDTDGK